MSLIGYRRSLMFGNICSVTFNLDGLTTSASRQAYINMPYTASFTCLDDKQFIPSSVRVIMGGVEITKNVFNFETGVINIPRVTGNIEITAEALTISSSVLSSYDIIPYITCVYKTGAPGINLGFYPTEKTKILFTYVWTGGSAAHIHIQRNTMMSSETGIYLGFADVSGSMFLAWAGRKAQPGGFTFASLANEITDVNVDRGAFDISCKSLKAHKTYNMHVDGETFTGNQYLTILGNTTSTDAGAVYGYIYRYKHWEDDVLVGDFIPVRRKSDGRVGIYDIIANAFKFKNHDYWLEPYVKVTNSYTNCTPTRVSAALTGTVNYAVIGKTWQYRYTPSNGYGFGTIGFFRVLLNGVDVTSTVAAYDSTNDTYTVTLNPHWNDNIIITARPGLIIV